jgi:hypothetical protein
LQTTEPFSGHTWNKKNLLLRNDHGTIATTRGKAIYQPECMQRKVGPHKCNCLSNLFASYKLNASSLSFPQQEKVQRTSEKAGIFSATMRRIPSICVFRHPSGEVTPDANDFRAASIRLLISEHGQSAAIV